jgi:para-nitrobenzyl esterase
MPNRTLSRWTFATLATILVLAAPVPGADTGARVRIDTGELQGTVEGSVVAFKGIPYAAPPVGDLRWRAPQPAPAWTGVRQAAEYGHDCM